VKVNDMTRELTPIDVSHVPDLLRIVEEVADSGKPRLLRRGNEDVAIIMPIKATTLRRRSPRKKTEADYEAFLSSAGTWNDGDIDEFLRENYESRKRSVRPPVDL
jgi:hypothetical protein